jgi:alanyl-tRNA synthetase
MKTSADDLREKYLRFFASKGHSIIPSASLVPEGTDASTLFTTAGMHPLVPYLLGESHPGGSRIADAQKCVRTGDIDDVGDNRHLTFFEMLGNWSFGDYFKKEAIAWSYEFLMGNEWLSLDKERLYVTVFGGGDGIPRDEESIAVWQDIFGRNGISSEVSEDGSVGNGVRIVPLGTDDNFWIAGTTGPCGGDTEMFYDTRPEAGPLSGDFSKLVESGRLMEVWNDVFMEFERLPDGRTVPLSRRNVDTGMGIERVVAMLEGKDNVFDSSVFSVIFRRMSTLSCATESEGDSLYPSLDDDSRRSARIVADHVRTAVFMIGDGIVPSNTERGYVLRRIIRRMIRHARVLGMTEGSALRTIAEAVITEFSEAYPELAERNALIVSELGKEETKFRETLERGMKEFERMIPSGISGKEAFDLYQSYGFPFELTRELAKERGIDIDEKAFQEELRKHQELSRTASAGMFKGGLQEQDARTAMLHTATHLLQAALRQVLGPHIYQKGSNITSERLRFDFAHQEKLTPDEKERVEALVNEAIRTDFPVTCEEMTVDEAKAHGAIGIFDSKYGDVVKVYSAGDFSREICGGPHAERTGALGHFRIVKEEASSAGVRRIKAVLE